SIYQVGGNTGQALAPIITALILVPLGQIGAAWFTAVAAIAVGLLIYIAFWYTGRLQEELIAGRAKKQAGVHNNKRISKKIWSALILVLFLIFARSWYISGMTNFYAFYAIEKYSFSISQAQLFLFAFLVS